MCLQQTLVYRKHQKRTFLHFLALGPLAPMKITVQILLAKMPLGVAPVRKGRAGGGGRLTSDLQCDSLALSCIKVPDLGRQQGVGSGMSVPIALLCLSLAGGNKKSPMFLPPKKYKK